MKPDRLHCVKTYHPCLGKFLPPLQVDVVPRLPLQRRQAHVERRQRKRGKQDLVNQDLHQSENSVLSPMVCAWHPLVKYLLENGLQAGARHNPVGQLHPPVHNGRVDKASIEKKPCRHIQLSTPIVVADVRRGHSPNRLGHIQPVFLPQLALLHDVGAGIQEAVGGHSSEQRIAAKNHPVGVRSSPSP